MSRRQPKRTVAPDLSPHHLHHSTKSCFFLLFRKASQAIMAASSSRNNAAVLIIGAGVSGMFGGRTYFHVFYNVGVPI